MSRIQSRIVFLSTVCALCAGAADIYTVTTTIPSGGIDLTALGDGYRQDAIAGQAAGANLPIAVTGRVVHASGLSPANPFVVSNAVASSYFLLKDAGLVGEVPIRVAGAGTTYFPGTTLTNDSDAANGLFRARRVADRQPGRGGQDDARHDVHDEQHVQRALQHIHRPRRRIRQALFHRHVPWPHQQRQRGRVPVAREPRIGKNLPWHLVCHGQGFRLGDASSQR